MITPEHPFLVPPGGDRISRDGFRRVILAQAAPAVKAERDPGDYYDAILATTSEDGQHVDPLLMLAKFHHESSMGAAGAAATTRSWGNTRPPSFGAPEIGRLPQTINGKPNGYFSKYGSWLDGCVSTAARMTTEDYVYTGWGRTQIRHLYQWNDDPDTPQDEGVIVWAPAGDYNNPASYLRAVIDFMNAHTDQNSNGGPGPAPPARRVHVALGPGHWDTNGDEWSGEERKRTRPLARAIQAELERRGFRVTYQDPEPFNGTYGDVASWFARLFDRDPFDLLLQVHFEGTNPALRGAFGVYPDNAGRKDHDLEARALGIDIAARQRAEIGIPIRNDGSMSESATNAKSLALFSRTMNAAPTAERLLMEYAASNSNLADRAIVDSPGYYERAARVTVDAIEAKYGRQTTTPPTPPEEEPIRFAEVPYTITGGFRSYWLMLGQARHPGTDVAANYLTLGLPRSGEFDVTIDGHNRRAQLFDNGALMWQPDQPRPYDVRPPLTRQYFDILDQGETSGALTDWMIQAIGMTEALAAWRARDDS